MVVDRYGSMGAATSRSSLLLSTPTSTLLSVGLKRTGLAETLVPFVEMQGLETTFLEN